MDEGKGFSLGEQREMIANCKKFFEVAWSCRENDDMAGYADALADALQELNKYPHVQGIFMSDEQLVQSIREERDPKRLDEGLDFIIGQIRGTEKLLGLDFLADLLRPEKL
jgi:hypothetical protein